MVLSPSISETLVVAGAAEKQASIRAEQFIMPTFKKVVGLVHEHLSAINSDTAPELDGVLAPFLKYASGCGR